MLRFLRWHTCVYIYISEIEGNYSTQETPNREIGFGFVSCSCRACERAGEAKLCGRVRGECLSTLGVSVLTFPSAWVISLPSQPQPPSPQTPYHTTCGLIGIYTFFLLPSQLSRLPHPLGLEAPFAILLRSRARAGEKSRFYRRYVGGD